jgi:hypothetical protein
MHACRYGPLFKTNLVGQSLVVSMDAEVNRFIFQQEGKLFRSWYPDTTNIIFGKESLASCDGSLHKFVRSFAARLFSVEQGAVPTPTSHCDYSMALCRLGSARIQIQRRPTRAVVAKNQNVSTNINILVDSNWKSEKPMASRGLTRRRHAYMLLGTCTGAAAPSGSTTSVLGSYSHCPPTSLHCSMTVTTWPSRRSSRAAAKPAMPPPTTHTLFNCSTGSKSHADRSMVTLVDAEFGPRFVFFGFTTMGR